MRKNRGMGAGTRTVRQVLFLFISWFVLLSALACVQKTGSQSGGKKVILASFYPVYIMTKNLTAGVPGVEVHYLAPLTTGCLHDYSLKPNDRLLLDRAGIFIINGLGMESFLDKAVSQSPNLRIIDSSTGIVPLVDDKTKSTNPHVWVSVSKAILQVRNIAEGLARLDPDHRKLYRINSEKYINRLTALKDEMHAGLKNIKNRDIVTFHEAFPYFASEFGLRIAAVVEREPGSEPSAREMTDTVNLIRKLKVKAVFAEPQYAPKSARAIGRETGVPVYELDPAVTGPDTDDAYIRIMESNLKILEEALK